MHNEIREFFLRMKLNAGAAFNAERVLECGSFDINGNPRKYFSSAKEYIGIDWRPGPGVDEVSLVHEYKSKPDGYFGFVIATSLIEHDPHWEDSIARMCALLADDGSLLLTCGGPGFHQHELETAPGFTRGLQQSDSGVYYGNRTAAEVVSQIASQARFRRIYVEDDPTTKDIRIFAVDKMPALTGVPAGMDPKTGVSPC